MEFDNFEEQADFEGQEANVDWSSRVADKMKYVDGYPGEELLKAKGDQDGAKEKLNMIDAVLYEWVGTEDWEQTFDGRDCDDAEWDTANNEWIIRSGCVHQRTRDGLDPGSIRSTSLS